jgi:choline-phosphate cytidylyltransferase/glycerol-3-phosphate cytidylyltransferase
MSTVFTAGVWDILHIGHIKLLTKAKSLGNELIVGVLTDEAAERYKPRPIIPFAQRIEIVACLRMVDDVYPIHNSDATDRLKQLKPDILVHGSDLRDDWEIGQTWMKNNNRSVVIFPYTEGVSSSWLKENIRAIK